MLTFHYCPKKLRVVQYAAPVLLHFQNPRVCALPFVANRHLCAAIFKFEPRGARLEARARCDAQHNNLSAQAQLQRRLADILASRVALPEHHRGALRRLPAGGRGGCAWDNRRSRPRTQVNG